MIRTRTSCGSTSPLVALLCAGLLARGASPAVAKHMRWPIKTGLPSSVSPTNGTSLAIGDLMGLGDAPGVTKNDKRYDTKRIPTAVGGHTEGQVISTKGYLLLVAHEPDGDFHIQVSNKPSTGTSNTCLIVEIPPDDSTNPNASTRGLAGPMRQWVRDRLLKGREPGSSGNVMRHPPYVTVTGQLFYDDSHVGDPPRGKRGIKASTLWELHPVTAIGFAARP